MTDLPHVVIVGGGFGGLHAARALSHARVRVTLVDRHNYHLFQPLLYQVATASLSPGDIASPIRWVLRHQKNVQVLLADVRAVDTGAKRLELDRDELSYDYLILTPGASHSYFGHSEWAHRAPGLKSLDDALEIRRQVLLAFEAAEREENPAERTRLLTFVIVGGGPTGVELAGALAEIARMSLPHDFRSINPRSSRIILLEGGPWILSTFPESLREAARTALERLGVEVHTRAVVTQVDENGVVVSKAATATAEATTQSIAAQTVVWAAGVAASPLAKSLNVPLDRAGRVTPQPTLALVEHPEVFVAGDLCAFVQDGKPLAGVAQVAMQEGTHAARNVLRAIEGQPLQPFHYRDYGTMATIGRGSAIGDIHGVKLSGFFGWIFWIFLHIFMLIGFRNRVVVLSEWAWSFFTLQRRVRLITGGKLWPSS
ncbi:MAG TPA: NAD(P)/FAD-dependent oxidoreductase [Vicinamibacterales bacterium]|jgi:NADH dehydrogenase